MSDTIPGSDLAPFSCTYSAQVPELLLKLNCSIAVSTYQAGKLIFISPGSPDNLVQLPRTFNKPMGFSLNASGKKLALACKNEVVVFAASDELALHYPKSPNKYDTLYLPRTTYHTGGLDIHDLQFGANDGLYAVNSLFSCLVKIDDNYNFVPVWKPKQIDKLVSEDRCHLNGMAMLNGKPKYASAFGTGNSFQSWRETVTAGGVIYDVESSEVVAGGLAMPHSPKLFNNELYVLLSAKGELVKINPASGTYDVVMKIDGFVRGMSLHKDYLFVATSRLRKNSSTFAKLDFSTKTDQCGIMVIHLPTASIAGKLTYNTSVDEIYDIHIIPGKTRPNILNTATPDHLSALMTPEATYWAAINPNEHL
ncbi:MAG: TIGR03032 family protein [Bacteroidia bacterium]